MAEIANESGGMSRTVAGAQSRSAGGAWAFADYTLDSDSGRLLRGRDEIPLRPKSFDVLAYLVANAGRLVSREALLAAVWSDRIVTDDSLTHCIADIRKALGEPGADVVRTVPRRGYVFSATVTAATEPRNDSPVPTQAVDGDGTTVAPPARSRVERSNWKSVAALALLCALAFAWWANRDMPSPEPPLVAQPPPNSVAVLRFADMSETQDQAYLADGLADEILHVLAQSPELVVIARTSSFALENEDIATVAAALNVAYVLEGSVRRSGDIVRVTAQLVDAATSAHMWSQTYDIEPDDLFEVQSAVAGAVAQSLQVSLAGDSEPPIKAPRDARTYDLFLRGQFLYNRRAPGDVERARELYEQALAIDPEFGRAWVGLVAIYNLQAWDRPGDALDVRHHQAVEQSLRLAPALPEAHTRAAVYHTLNGDLASRFEHIEQALRLDPDHPLVLGLLSAQHLWGDRLDDSLSVVQRAVLRDPLGQVTRLNLAHKLLLAGRLDEAMTEFRNVLELRRLPADGSGRVDKAVLYVGQILLLQRQHDEARAWIETWPPGVDRHYALAMLEHALGRPAEADAALERLMNSAGTANSWRIAEVYAYRGEFDDALTWLQRVPGHGGCRVSDTWQAYYSPFLARMRGDARWQAWRSGTAQAMQECDYRFSLPT